MVRLSGSGAALLALLATAGLGFSEGGSAIKTGGSGNSAYTANFVQVPGATPAAVNVTVTINSQACGGACGWMSIGFGTQMSGSKTYTCFNVIPAAATQLCATTFSKPPACATQSTVSANSFTFNSPGNFVCSFVSSGIGGQAWADTQSMVMAYGKGTSFSSMEQHAGGAGFSLGTVSFSSGGAPTSAAPTSSAAQTGAGVMSALLMVLATLL
jgi:hypothetical protein